MSLFSTSRKSEPAMLTNGSETAKAASEPNGTIVAPPPAGGVLSRGVSIKGSVKFRNELLIDGEVEGKINSTGTLTIGEHGQIRGEIKAKAIQLRGAVEGNIFASERCQLQAGCTLRGDIEAPRLVVDENATFVGSAKVAPTPKRSGA
jgi:cytoskeletal protein CcmA (bactofilin family)